MIETIVISNFSNSNNENFTEQDKNVLKSMVNNFGAICVVVSLSISWPSA